MKTIYFVRHGESVGNAAPVFQSPDEILSEKGRKQAEFLAKRAEHLPIQTLVASTMTRAQETARIISSRIHKEVESSDLFVERRSPSEIVGRSLHDEEAKRWAKEWERSIFSSNTRFSNAENFDDLRQRALQGLAFLEKRTESDILVVSHGFSLRMLIGQIIFGDLLTPEFFEKKMNFGMLTKNTGISVVRCDPEALRKWSLLVWNDHAHLADA